MADSPITHSGWTLETDQEQDGDGFYRDEHFAVKGDERVHLHGIGFRTSFWPTQERFRYLVDHGFPRAPRGGNWFNDELDRLIAEENADAAKICEPPGTSPVVEGQDGIDAVVRGSEHSPEAGEG